MPLSSGTRLGPYEIVAPLGAGGMGEVYRANDTRLGRNVAIKILPLHLSSNPQLRDRFDREARAISSLNHPRICTLHDVGHQDGTDFLVMEYLEGESLDERLRRGPVPLKETLKIGTDVCEALEVAHRAGITHRDLKPGNIMLTKNGAKLMDFGLAKGAVAGMAGSSAAPLLSAAKTISGPSPMSPLTTAGQVVGTIQYMSPEQIEGKEADARSDLFALGAVLYEMASGKRPFEGKSQISVASAILEKDPQPLSTTQPLTPPAFERVVDTCLAKNPDDRFQSARDVRLELKWISETPEPTAAAATPAAKTPTKALPWVIAALLAIALAGTFLFPPGGRKSNVRYTRVSFRHGQLQAARFSHDGQTIIYSGEWEDQPPEITLAHPGSPESRPLGIPSATIAGVSSSDELAIIRDCQPVFLMDCGGTLARVSLAGGSPRDQAGDVAYADWSPDGKNLVVSKISAEGASLEFPIGHVLFRQNAGWFGHPRFSPDGTMIAFENHPDVTGDMGTVDTVDLNGKHTVLSQGWVSIEGLAWNPNGKEVWFAANSPNSGWADTVFAVTLSGKLRTVLTFPNARLHDIASDGRVLLSREDWREQLVGFFPGDKQEHFYSWLDNTNPTGISSDGRTISFNEQGEIWYIAKDNQGYYRSTDGSAAVSVGPGTPTISPDGKWLLTTSMASQKLQIQPIGVGQPMELQTPGLVQFSDATWSDDGRYVAYEGKTTQGDWNAYVQAIAGGPPKLVKTEGRRSFPELSADGSMLALRKDSGGILLYHLNGEASAPVAVQGAEPSEYPVRFADGGKSLLVTSVNGQELVATLIDLANGHRTMWKRFADKARPGLGALMVVTPDLKYYAYAASNCSADLYVVSNLR